MPPMPTSAPGSAVPGHRAAPRTRAGRAAGAACLHLRCHRRHRRRATLGLPEAPGHSRQFDYRYSWLRDASLAVTVASLLGQRGDAARYLAFVRSITAERLVPAGPLVDIRSDTVPDERVMYRPTAASTPRLGGWSGSWRTPSPPRRPVNRSRRTASGNSGILRC